MDPASPSTVYVDPRPAEQPPALGLIDDVQGVRTQLSVSHACRPTHSSTDRFRFPVDVAYKLPPLVIWVQWLTPVIVRNEEGTVCAEITNRESTTLPHGQYTVDLCSLGLKVYLFVDGELEISFDRERGRTLDCSAAETVQLGLRSFHESPSATVTTTDRPRDVMRGLSCLGSALKTTSCERSFPTLRGHPPLLERGEQFHAPPALERTDETASVRIEVPPTLDAVYPVAPLAYYLNAVVRPGEQPQIVAGDSTVALDRGEGTEHGATQLLKHVFTLDCVNRTEGLYPIELGERAALEDRLTDAGMAIDFAALYDRPLAEQLQQYASIPFELVEDFVPRWPLTADVRPVAKHLPYLPFVVASLGTIRCLSTSRTQSFSSDPPEIEAFYRNTEHTGLVRSNTVGTATHTDLPTRSPDGSPDTTPPANIHGTQPSDSIIQLWLADGYPIQGAKPTLDAFHRRFDAIKAESYKVAVISNDTAMEAESNVAELYGHQERIEFDVTMYEQLTRGELRAVFAKQYDFVHYVGHVDAQGLQCTDGWLDANELDTVNVRLFILNGCRSYEQGRTLVDRGAIGGLCTVTNVGNTPATHIGRTVARLIKGGFSLGGALDIVGDGSLAGQQYMIVGDPCISIIEDQGQTSVFPEITPAPDNDAFSLKIHSYQSMCSGPGTMYAPDIGDKNTYYLIGSPLAVTTMSCNEMTEYLRHERFPVRVDGSLLWSDEISPDSIETTAH